MLKEASALGHLDSTFVLGMMLMAEGRHRKHEALDMLTMLTADKKVSGILEQLVLSSKKMYEVRSDPQVYRTSCINMFEGMGPKTLKADSFIHTCALHNNIEAMYRQGNYGNFDLGLTLLRKADEDHLEAIYLLGMIYISRGPHQCDEGLQLLDTYFGWAVPDDREYTGVVDSAKELLWAIDVVHILTTNNITFQCEDPHHSVKGALTIGHKEDEDRQRYCTIFRWYVEYGRFVYFLKILIVDNRMDIEY
ncbi:unnamed protein product [Lactuca saligna]|uniref:At2g35280-like TPR domain-containing protein n=1 Tax=Lactuca saligna TaxID=75948 RepID=A0AA35Y8D3_LACSI|nr:unnamed protein product [Lactuca saligna]